MKNTIKTTAIIVGIIALDLLAFYALYLRQSPWKSVQHHVICRTNGEIVYDADVFDPIYRGNSVDVYDPELGRRIVLTGDVIMTY